MTAPLSWMPTVSSDLTAIGPEAELEHGLPGSFVRPIYGGDLDNGRLNSIFQTLFYEADRYRTPFVAEWLEAYRQYNGYPEEGDKEPWQANINIPYASQTADLAAARIMSAMFDDPDFIEVIPNRTADDLLTTFARRALLWLLKRSRANEPMKEAVKDAVICGNGYVKAYYRTETVEETQVFDALPMSNFESYNQFLETLPDPLQAGKKLKFRDWQKLVRMLRVESPVPTNIWLDPTGQNRYIIQRIPRTLTDVQELAEPIRDEATQRIIRPAVYDIDEVRKINFGNTDSQRVVEESAVRRDESMGSEVRQRAMVDLYEFWGDFPDPDRGTTLYKNVVITFVNRQYCIRRPQKNPFLHRKSPFVALRPRLQPHQIYGYGLLMLNMQIQRSINRQMNLMLDKAALSVPALECDPTMAKNPNDLRPNPVYRPGKIFDRKPGRPESRIFYAVDGFSGITQEDIGLYDKLERAHQLTSPVNEFVSGGPASSTRRTKGEVEERVAATDARFNEAAVYIEETGLSPLMQIVYDLMLQYEENYDDVTLTKMFGDSPQALEFVQAIMQMTPEQRWRDLKLPTEISVIGISNQIHKQKMVQNYTSFAQVMLGNPQTAPFLNWPVVINGMRKAMDMPPEVIVPNAEQVLQMVQQAQVQQIAMSVMQPPQMGAGNPHNSAANAAGEAGRAVNPGAQIEGRPQ